MNREFGDNFAFGVQGKQAIATLFRNAGRSVQWLTQHSKIILNEKSWMVAPAGERYGPRLTSFGTSVIVPDLLVTKSNGQKLFVDVKRKGHFVWYRRTETWRTGIDHYLYLQYLKVDELTDIPVVLLFFHDKGKPGSDDLCHGCPKESPTGLFFGRLKRLADADCVHNGDGLSNPMVYWDSQDLSHRPMTKKIREALKS